MTYGSTLLQRMERQRKREQHRAKLKQIANRKPGWEYSPGTKLDAGFDNAPPRGFASYKAQMAAKRYKQGRKLLHLDVDNYHFLRRVVKARNMEGDFNRFKKEWERTRTKRKGNTPKVLTSLNVSGRRQNMIRIMRENKILLDRLKASKSEYTVRDWMKEYKKNEYVRQRMSKHVPNEEVPAHLMRGPGALPKHSTKILPDIKEKVSPRSHDNQAYTLV